MMRSTLTRRLSALPLAAGYVAASLTPAGAAPAPEPAKAPDPTRGIIGSVEIDQREPVILPETVEAIRATFGDRFSSIHIERSKVGPVVVLSLVRPTAADRAIVEKSVAELQGQSTIKIRVRLRAVDRSELDWNALEARMAKRFPESAVLFDPVGQELTVTRTSADQRRDADPEAPDGVRFETLDSETLAYPAANTDGVRIFVEKPGGGACTSAFLFNVPSGPHMATAGHCWFDLDTHAPYVTSQVKSSADDGFGPGINPTFNSDGNATWNGDSVDIGSYFTPGAIWANARIYLGPDSSAVVAGVADPASGQSVCYRGATSATKKCGTIETTPGAGSQIFTVRGFEAQPGDSGAPLFRYDANNNALVIGILHARNPADLQQSYWNTASGALGSWGGTIMTGAAPAK